MSRRRLTILASLVAAATACGESERAAPPAEGARRAASASWLDSLDDGPPHRILGCLTGDSAVYGAVRADPETGDTIGVWLTFYRAGGGVDGMRVLGGIDRADTMLFTRVQLGGDDSVAFDVPAAAADPFSPAGTDTARFLGRVACDRLWGRQRERRDLPSRAAVYQRVIQAPPSSDEAVP